MACTLVLGLQSRPSCREGQGDDLGLGAVLSEDKPLANELVEELEPLAVPLFGKLDL